MNTSPFFRLGARVAALLPMVSIQVAAAQNCAGWIERTVNPPPGAYGDAMAYDAARKQTVMFVPAQNLEKGRTWAWDGEQWIFLADNFEDGGPYVHGGQMMAYDSKRQVVVCYGGTINGYSSSEFLEWDGLRWNVPFASPPYPRSDAGMAFDSNRDMTVLFGGWHENADHSQSYPLGETWEWDGQTWKQVADGSPPPNAFGAMAFDPMRGVCVTGPIEGKTWEWDGSSWTPFNAPGPADRASAAMVYSSDLHACILFGGTTNFGVRNDMWAWDGATWTELHPEVRPSARRNHGMAYDSARHAIVLFGGIDAKGKHLTDTWEYLCEPPPCYPDFDGDGSLDLFDFLSFVNLFNAPDPKADCDQNGILDLFDFLCFVNAFNEGC